MVVLNPWVCAGPKRVPASWICVADPPTRVKVPLTIVSATPPASWFAPTINLSLKSGVPLVPSQSCHPTGMEDIVPDHMIIEPLGSDNEPGVGTALLTEFEDVELVGRSRATRLVHSVGTVVETVKLFGVEEIEYGFCQGLTALHEGFI